MPSGISENERMSIDELIKTWEEPLEKVFPTKVKTNETRTGFQDSGDRRTYPGTP